jgi:hypothetical protein
MGGASLKGVDVFWWGDAENAIDYWINGLDQHLVALGTQQRTGTKMGGILMLGWKNGRSAIALLIGSILSLSTPY